MRHALIYGRRRQGKTTLALALAVVSKRRPIIAFDPCSQYSTVPVVDLSELDSLAKYDGVVRIVPGDPVEGFLSMMDHLDSGSWRWRNYSLILDEASFLQKPQYMEPGLARIIRLAPDDIFVAQTIHRPSESHPTIRALATDVFFFHSYLERDVDVIEGTWGAQVSDGVQNLPQYNVLHTWINPGGKQGMSIWNNPNSWNIAIRETENGRECPASTGISGTSETDNRTIARRASARASVSIEE